MRSNTAHNRPCHPVGFRLFVIAALVNTVACLAAAQSDEPRAAQATESAPTSQPATAPTSAATERELPPGILAVLSRTQDFRLDFDQPGFYAVVEFVQRSNAFPGTREQPIEVADWRTVAERPADFRGRPMTIEGIVGHNKNWALNSRPQLGTLWQLELYQRNQALACTAVFTHDASDVPVGATVRLTGYFVLVRDYLTQSKETRHALLLIAPGPLTIVTGASDAGRTAFLDQPSVLLWTFGAMAGGLVIALLVLRRAAGARQLTDFSKLRARNAPPNPDDAWMEQPNTRGDEDDGTQRGGPA